MSDEILKECSSDCGCMAEIGTIIHENDTVYDFKLEGNKEKVLELSKQGQVLAKPSDLIKEPYVFEFLGIKEQKPLLL